MINLLLSALSLAGCVTESHRAVEGSGNQGNGLIGMASGAVIDQVLDSMTDRTHDLSRLATRSMVFSSTDGLLYRPRHPDFEIDQRGR